MRDPKDRIKKTLADRVARLRGVTFLILLSERITYAALPLFTWLCFFGGVWLSGILAGANPFIAYSVSGVFMIGTIYLTVRAARRFTLPLRQETDRRLQEQSGVRHRPLSDIQDRLAHESNEETRILWDKSRGALPGALARLRLGLPRPVMAMTDPAALRIGALLILIAGFVMAGNAWPARLRDGLWPFAISPAGIRTSDTASLTITPPAYTGVETVIVKGVHKDEAPPLDIPEGSTIKAHVTGGFGKARLSMDQTHLDMDALDDKSYALETTVLPGSEISIDQMFGARVKTPYRLIADTAPSIRQDGDIVILPRGDIRIPLVLNDDYGVRDLQMRLDIDPSVVKRPLGKFHDEIRAVMTAGGKDVKLQPVYNLSFHPWAGLPVRLSFLATDDKGQAAVLPPISLTLPERKFSNPIAAKLIEIRKQLAWEPEADPKDIGMELIAIVTNPGVYRGDYGVHLALSAAIYRLAYSPGVETAEALIPVLWDVAVHIEDGDVSKAMADLNDIREKLEAALDDPNATDEEIAGLVAQLQDAMQRYFQEMAKSMQQRMQEGQQVLISPEMLTQMLTPQDLQMFFDQLQAQAMSGDKDSAREMLSRLSQLMDTLDPSMNTELPKDMQMMAEAMNKLQDLIDKQQDLLDETRNKAEAQAQAPEDQAPDHAQDQKNQESIRSDLSSLMQAVGEQAGEIPENMGQAEQEMRGSSKSLEAGDAMTSIEHQQEAIRQLKQAKEQMGQKLAQRLSQMTGISMGGPGSRLDPLGRPYGKEDGTNPLLGEKVKIPDESDRKKIEDILQTLRKKSGDMSRPPEELDYYRRLLKQF